MALAGGNLAEDGPKVVSAKLQDANTLLVKVTQDRSAGFAALDPDAAAGVGWSVRSSGGVAVANRVEMLSVDTLQIHFASTLPSDGVVFYGYGYGRLAAYNQPGQGNAIYDQTGMPIWTPTQGVRIDTAAPPSPTPTAPAPIQTTLGSGSDTLVLRISQDAYQGNAQYTVKVDNVQIGGTQTATAWHSSGQSDTLTIKGNWAIGNHNVAVTFLNDAWGGTSTTDRNLYVDGMTYDGAAVANGSAALRAAGPATFTVMDNDLMFA